MIWEGYRSRGRRQVGRRQLLGTALAGGTAAAFLAACGGSGSNDRGGSGSGGSREATIAPSTRVAETGQPKPGGTISVRQGANAPLDPHLNSTYTAQTLASYVYARLLKFKTGVDTLAADAYEVEGDLAEGFETPSDGTTVTFKLRANAKWHDIAPVSGRAVDAEDVRFSLERFRTDPKSSNRAVFGSPQNPLVESVTAPDPRTVVIKLAKPYAPFTTLITASNYLWIMPKEIGSNGFDPAKQMIGAGPFMLDSVQPDQQYKVKKNPSYYASPMPYVDNVTMVIINEEVQEVSQFQAGRLDIAAIPPNDVDQIKKTVSKAEILEYLPTTYGFLAFQSRTDNPFKDERVRQAASMAIDRDGILTLAYNGKGSWQAAIPAQFARFRVDPKTDAIGAGQQFFKYNPAEAKKLLAAAGFPNGLDMRFVFTNNIYGERFNAVAEAMAGFLKEGGFRPQIVTQDYLREYIAPGAGTFFGNFDHVFYGLQADFPDPHDYLYNMNHSKSARNHAGVNDPRLDAMIDKEERTLDDAERAKIVKEIQVYLGQKLYYAPTAVGPAYIGVQPWIKNFQRNNSYGSGAESRAKLWIDKG
ncbi:MAG: ABC transporter substrate-binding protein [Chloroflexi bacterium]|nr:ABC transporter substrate-binding protein [Chloroflexota bacterium]